MPTVWSSRPTLAQIARSFESFEVSDDEITPLF
jgi:hypothetical protein